MNLADFTDRTPAELLPIVLVFAACLGTVGMVSAFVTGYLLGIRASRNRERRRLWNHQTNR